MKYKLIIDKDAEEEIIAIVHAPSGLTQQIENLVFSFSGPDCILGYREDEMRKLIFKEIECITSVDRKVIAIDNYLNIVLENENGIETLKGGNIIFISLKED